MRPAEITRRQGKVMDDESKDPLRMGGRGRDFRCAAGWGGRPFHSKSFDGPVGGGIRLVARVDLDGRGREYSVVRIDWSFCCGSHESGRTAAGRAGLAVDRLACGAGIVADERALAVAVTLGVLVGIGTGATSMVLSAVVANRWFFTHRGLVVGFLSAANATGQLIFLPFMSRIIAQSGWRAMSLAVGCVTAVTAVVAWIVMRDSPASIGLRPYGAPAAAMAPLAALRFASGKPEFWLLAGTFFVCGASTNGLIGTHLIPACHDNGIPEVRAAGLLALMGIFDILGTTASGWLTDRVSPRLLLCVY